MYLFNKALSASVFLQFLAAVDHLGIKCDDVKFNGGLLTPSHCLSRRKMRRLQHSVLKSMVRAGLFDCFPSPPLICGL